MPVEIFIACYLIIGAYSAYKLMLDSGLDPDIFNLSDVIAMMLIALFLTLCWPLVFVVVIAGWGLQALLIFVHKRMVHDDDEG